jgi:hypothetical protein
MTIYTGLQGQTILITDTDPTTPIEGQIWYNTTSNLLKGRIALTAGWASAPNLNTGRGDGGGFGIQTAAISAGGYISGATGATESFSGTSWTTVNPLNTAQYYCASTGTQTAGLLNQGSPGAAPYYFSTSESWNGTSWTATNPTSTTGYNRRTVGTLTAALSYGGQGPSQTPGWNLSESFNGTTWTATPALNTKKLGTLQAGTQTAALSAGGDTNGSASYTSAVELYNGTWTTSPATLTPATGYGWGAGSQTAALLFGGNNPGTLSTLWNGTAFSATTPMSNPGQRKGSGNGTSSAVLAFQGAPSPATAVESWVGPGSFGTKTITTA